MLGKVTQSRVFRVQAIDPAMRTACVRGLNQKDRVWFLLAKTKMYRMMKLNNIDFFKQQSQNIEKLKYDSEIKKDLQRTFPENEEFNKIECIEKLRRTLNVLCMQHPNRVGYVQGMNFVAGVFL